MERWTRGKAWTAAILLVLNFMAMSACAITAGGRPASLGPNVQTEGQVALYADQIVKLADSVLDSVEVITDQRLALQPDPAQDEKIKAEARKVIEVAQAIGKGGSDLATVLKAVDQAKTQVDRNGALANVRVAVLAFSKSVTSAQLQAVTDGGGLRTVVLRFLGNVSNALMQVALVLPQPVQ